MCWSTSVCACTPSSHGRLKKKPCWLRMLHGLENVYEFAPEDVKAHWLGRLSLWRRLTLAGTGPGSANMKHLLSFFPQKLWLLKGSLHHWTSVLWFDTIVQNLPFCPLSPCLLASDRFPFYSGLLCLSSLSQTDEFISVEHANATICSACKCLIVIF